MSQETKIQWITDRLPDSDMTVLVRRQDPEFPVWPGFHDGECWRSCDLHVDHPYSKINVPVLGWMELEDAASVLDKLSTEEGQK